MTSHYVLLLLHQLPCLRLLACDHHSLLHLRSDRRSLAKHARLLLTGQSSGFASIRHLIGFHPHHLLPALRRLGSQLTRWTLANGHPQHLTLMELPLRDQSLDVLDLLSWGKIAQLRILGNYGRDVDGSADLRWWDPGSLWHHPLLLSSQHAHHGLLLLLLRHQGLLLQVHTHRNGRSLAGIIRRHHLLLHARFLWFLRSILLLLLGEEIDGFALLFYTHQAGFVSADRALPLDTNRKLMLLLLLNDSGLLVHSPTSLLFVDRLRI